MMCTHVLATPYLSSLSLSLSKDTHYSIQCFELNYKNHLLCMRKPHSLIHARAHLFFFPKKFILHQLKCHYVHTFSPFIGQSLPTSIWATSLIYLTHHLHSIVHIFVLYVSHVIHAPLSYNGRGGKAIWVLRTAKSPCLFPASSPQLPYSLSHILFGVRQSAQEQTRRLIKYVFFPMNKVLNLTLTS